MPETTRTMAKVAERRTLSRILEDHPAMITWITLWTIVSFFALIVYGVS